LADKLTEDEKTGINAALAEVKEAVKAGDVDALKPKLDALMKAMSDASSRIYQQAAQQAPPQPPQQDGPQPPPGDGAGGFTDADYRIVD